MNDSVSRQVLLLGSAASGKSTLLIQLHGRLKRGHGALRARGAPRTLAPIEAGLKRLEQGLAVEHTPKGTDVVLDLPAQSATGTPLNVALPEYAGEDLQTVTQHRRIPDTWRTLARSTDRWLLLLRLSQQPELPDVVTKPIGVLAQTPTKDGSNADVLPLDMWATELLQVLLYARGSDATAARSRPELALVLSCWDELQLADGTSPPTVAAQRLALLDAYCRSNWPRDAYAVYGLSAQGQALDRRKPSDTYVDCGPQAMGWIVLPDGTRHSDLTRLLAPE
ncbi:MAG: hypothetical protein JWR63_3341 [Conexibacter sp.]|nr:hypothetical protein [Conexibacter sp.]